ncbi:flagellar protein FlaG [Pseudomonas typographi]|uniref:Flagellar protein FlaG n=1 Tax=Pseudomonas typographi TaxID=2715964 RepID=A0ABR7YZJ1_9PSED|nr:flagellar protein FlaG [Pseudomonas typographi]MBD1586745.1 flagellar protein FlaG [Pseudomonas typographi]MBD1598639.1 flagellar protein FlaG [Pseudomonas typographi]
MDINLNVMQAAVATAQASTAGTTVTQQAVTSELSARKKADNDSRDPSLDEAIGSLQAYVAANQRNLEFSVDEGTGETVVKVIATQTGEVVRQMPSEVALKLAQSLKDGDSLLFNDWA